MTATATPRRQPPAGHVDAIATTDRLIRQWQNDRDDGAREALLKRFMPLASRLAARYQNPHEPLEDLVQVACVGLLGAIERFDSERGIPFKSFAIPTIIGELKRHFRNTGWTAHVPRGAQELALRVDRATREIAERSGRTPGPAEIAQLLEIDLADVLLGLEAGSAHFSTSLDAPATRTESEDPQPLGDLFGSDDDRYALVDTKLSLADAIPRLPYQQRTALHLRIERGLIQSEIAREMGCSQMQVSRLLRSASTRVHDLINPT